MKRLPCGGIGLPDFASSGVVGTVPVQIQLSSARKAKIKELIVLLKRESEITEG